MANKTAWVAGNGPGLTWTTAFNTTDFTTSDSSSLLANTHTVLSSVAAFTNSSNLDQFMNISLRLSISSSTIAAGANFSFWIYYLLDDGSTYGDGQLTAGTAAAKTPAVPLCGAVNLFAAASQTSLVGSIMGVPLAPVDFKLAIQNNSGFTLTNTTTVCKIQTYNINLNA
jgi:hypothetical protein